MNSLNNLLPHHPFWNALDTTARDILLPFASVLRFHQGEQIFRKDYDADHFYLIHSGKVSLETPFTPGNGVVAVQNLQTGDVMGWSWMFPPYRWQFGAKALEPTVATAFKAAPIRVACRDNPTFGYNLAMQVGVVMLDRLQVTRMRLLELCEVAQ